MSEPANNSRPDAYTLVPTELRETHQWVLWRYVVRSGERTKIPFTIEGRPAKTNTPSTWTSFAAAVAALAAGGFDGIGFVFSESDGFGGVDLDDSIIEGQLTDEAKQLVAQLNSYTEISPSGQGVKVFVRTAQLRAGKKVGGIEIYTQLRFFTVTGRHLPGTPRTVNEASDVVATLHARLTLAAGGNRPQRPRTRSADVRTEERIQRCRAFIQHLPDAVSGQNGHNRTFHVACELYKFGLNDAAARLLMGEYNAHHAHPPWSPRELNHKLADARREVLDKGEFGIRLRQSAKASFQVRDRFQAVPKELEFPLTDLGNAERFARDHRGFVYFVPNLRRWIVWDDARWRIDDCGAVDRLAKQTIRQMKRSAAELSDRRLAEQLFRHANSSEANRRIKDMLERAQKEEQLQLEASRLDADPMLMNVANGTLDLRTGQLRSHCSEDLITMISPVHFDADAHCPAFLAFLERTFGNDREMISFIQRVFGYCLTGLTSERCLFICYGHGANGKTTLLSIMRHVLGEYAKQLPAERLMASNYEHIPNDIARLVGARLVIASETEQDRRLAESLVKQMTGGEDVMAARFMKGEWFDFKPQFKLAMATNHLPYVRGTCPAIWDRLPVIPFNYTVPAAERDQRLFERLRSEAPGIVAWAVAGCLEWQRRGLGIPTAVHDATATYRAEMDHVGRFIVDCCQIRGDCRATAEDLYSTYRAWCEREGERALSQKQFGTELRAKGYERIRYTGGRSGWKGLKVVNDSE